jgi:hypothetical protein
MFENKWKAYQKAQTEGVKQKCAKEINKEAHLRAKPVQNTTIEEV